MNDTINIVIAGIGGQGVIKASDILSEAAFTAGYDVKKSEIHGMSQRGGSVTSDVRFAKKVFSPTVPPGEADFLVVLADDQVEINCHLLKKGGKLITSKDIDLSKIPNPKTLNTALLGALSSFIGIPLKNWEEAIRKLLPPKSTDMNIEAFNMGRKQ
ncbi:MAG TPA: pyruvate ferredoxin oxidoreductase [Lentisphaeria bacterium]|nr:MAG: pyruvate ferredoxin oxidoreductase [Lentisphaerae bacterium GWF2_49_21]HBC85347.1 pyruvate ferredoxin oxidoreductase [Lentisphaeria bacterium]